MGIGVNVAIGVTVGVNVGVVTGVKVTVGVGKSESTGSTKISYLLVFALSSMYLIVKILESGGTT